jgi:hypothetical protein
MPKQDNRPPYPILPTFPYISTFSTVPNVSAISAISTVLPTFPYVSTVSTISVGAGVVWTWGGDPWVAPVPILNGEETHMVAPVPFSPCFTNTNPRNPPLNPYINNMRMSTGNKVPSAIYTSI